MTDTRDSQPAGAPAPGDVVAGKYRVERVLGEGGMGIVVAARHIDLDERVALKVLRAEVVSPETTARFLREARSAAKIKSEHVVRVNDVGTLDAGTPFMVMELLEGKDLADTLRERGQLAVGEAVEILLQACEAVAEAHALGIVHRDLKPANLFLARRPGGKVCVKVVDFGISKVTSKDGAFGEDAAMTRTSTWLGSPLYMSPEQMRSARSVDARTDIWSLGLILYQSLAGRVPFDAPSLPDLCLKVVHEAPPPLAELRPGLPEGLVAVVMRCLEKQPDARYLNVAELAQDLAPFAPERARESVERIVGVIEDAGLLRPSKLPQAPPSEAPPWSEERPSTPPSRPPPSARLPVAPVAATAAPAATQVEARPSPPPPAPREEPRRRGGMLIAVVVVALAGAAAGFFAMRPPPAPPPPPTLPATGTASAPPVVTPESPADAGSVDAGSVDAGRPDAGLPVAGDAGARDAGSPDAGGPRPVRPRPVHPVEPTPSPVPVPQGPPPSAQTCFQTLPDGTVKQVPCP